MAKRQQFRARARARARSVGRGLARGAKGTAVQATSGVVGYFAQTLAASKIDFVAQNWWVGPAGLAAMGHLLKRKPRFQNVGAALCGAAGYAGAMGFMLRPKGETSGLVRPSEVGALVSQSGMGFLPELNQGTAVSYPTSAYYSEPSEETEADVSYAMNL